MTGRDSLLGQGGRLMAYALGGILLLAGVILYATAETGFELRRDQQQAEKMERGSALIAWGRYPNRQRGLL